MKFSKEFLLMVVGVVLIFSALALTPMLMGVTPTVEDVVAVPRTLAQVPTFATATVTVDEFNRLRNGMSYAQAVVVIDAAGEELSRTEILDTVTVMYMWKNSNGSNMNAMFQGDKLIAKAQFGLP